MIKTNTNKGNFNDLLRTYELKAIERTPQTEAEYAKALEALGIACVYSVLKKLLNVGASSVIDQIKRGFTADLYNKMNLSYAVNNSEKYTFNEEGNPQRVITDKALQKSIEKLINRTYGDGMDLLQTAMLKILKETKREDMDLQPGFMEEPYTITQAKRKVLIKKSDSRGLYETKQTTPIQEVFLAIRRDIQTSGSFQSASQKYTYLNETITDETTGGETSVYLRLPAYSNLADEVTDYNGKITTITTSREMVDTTERLIEKMNLTAKQAQILELRQRGYGYKAIATCIGITDSNVKGQIAQIRKKAKAIGLTPEK